MFSGLRNSLLLPLSLVAVFYPSTITLAQQEELQQLEEFLAPPPPEPVLSTPSQSVPQPSPAAPPIATPVRRSPPPQSLSESSPEALPTNRQLPGILGAPDQLAEGFYQDLYEFRGRRGDYVLLNLIGSRDPRMQLDPFLRLLGPDGDLVAEDDNSGRDPARGDARILLALPQSGTYTVVVTSAVPQDRGRYALALLEVDEEEEVQDSRSGCRNRIGPRSIRNASEFC